MLNKKAVLSKIKTAKQPQVLIIGDIMLDHYIEGSASRLSPEAPVPVLNVKRERNILGGAANVAMNLIALGAGTHLAGIIGKDEAGKQVLALAKNNAIDAGAILSDAERPTTIKSRVVAGTHQLLRFDKEDTAAISAAQAAALLKRVKAVIPACDIVVLSDYSKGVLEENFTRQIIALAAKAGKKVIVDPKGLNYDKYKGAYLVKPNRKELQEAMQANDLTSPELIKQAAGKLLAHTQSTYIVVTLSEDGIALVSEKEMSIFPVKANEVYDVTGAGDTVIAALTYFLAIGFAIGEACELANYAAAIVVKHVGSATASITEILDSI